MAAKKTIAKHAYLITSVTGKGINRDTVDGECVVIYTISPEQALTEHLTNNYGEDGTEYLWLVIPIDDAIAYSVYQKSTFEIRAE